MFNEFSEALASGDVGTALNSTVGTIIILVLAAVVLLGILVFTGSDKNESNKVKKIAYSGIALAIATALSQIKLFALPQGGSVTMFSMLFVIIIGYFFGVRQGILTGIVYGLIQLALGAWFVHPIQLLLDYPLAFGALGLSGLFTGSKNGLIKGVIVGTMGRFLCHFIAGIVFWSSIAEEGFGAITYSLWYNFSYTGVEAAVTIVVLLIPGVLKAVSTVKKSAMA